MEEYAPWIVYENLLKMIKYRGAVMDATPLSKDKFLEGINTYGYVIINATREEEDIRGPATMKIYLLAPGATQSNKSQDFKKLVNTLPFANDNLNVVFISERPFSVHIRKQIVVIKRTNPKVYMEDYDYEKFMLEVPAHKQVPSHEIVTEEEVDEFCRNFRTNKDKFQKILTSDAMAVWLGVRPGMTVKVKRLSETAGIAYVYKYCIKG